MNNNPLQEDVEAAIAFRIGEAAKQQVWNWAKWILGVAVVLLAIFGIRGYTDFQNAIKTIQAEKTKLIDKLDAEIDDKVDTALKRELAEIESAIKSFGDRAQKQYTDTILNLERTHQQSEENLRKVEEVTEKTLESVNKLVVETKRQFAKELQEVQKSKREALVAINLSFKGPVAVPSADRPAAC